MTNDISYYQVGQYVSVSVEEVFSYGVIVRLNDGSSGYISRREMSWDSEADPHQLVTIGEEISAIVSHLPGKGHSLRLSLKATVPDPWNEFVQSHEVGDVVHGTVKNLEPFGAFVQIVPGVDGLILCEHLAECPVSKPEEVVWVGDHVEAIITHINLKEHHVRLSMRYRIQQANEAIDVWHQIQTEEIELATDPLPVSVPTSSPTLGRLLIVDDEDTICEPLVRHLCGLGYEAERAEDIITARSKLLQHNYALLIVDVRIGHEDGLHFLAEMVEKLIDTAIVIMSGAETLAARATEIEALGVVTVLPKPLDTAEIETELQQIESGKMQSWRAEVRSSPSRDVQSSRLAMELPRPGKLDQRLQRVLGTLCDATQAHDAIVFHLDPTSNTTSIVTHIGIHTFNNGAIYKLHKSPVGDVIRDGQSFLENRADTGKKKQFDNLLTLLPFSSCIGVPIPAHSDPYYALFLFHAVPEAFHQYRVRDAQAAATLLATIIEQDRFAERAQQQNALLLTGQIAAGLQHEINNKLSGINLSLSFLQGDCGILQASLPALESSEEYRQMRQTLASVIKTVKGLRETVMQYQQLMLMDGGESARRRPGCTTSQIHGQPTGAS